MKKYSAAVLFILLLSPFGKVFSQDITGLWVGALYNDTTKRYHPYELALSEENGKLSGYSSTIFEIDGKKELGIKKLKIRKKGDQLFIEDAGLFFDTYSARPPKGVHQLTAVSLSVEDTIMVLSGKWSTNRTIKYLPFSGTVRLQRKSDYKSAELFKKLDSLNATNTLSFVPQEKKPEPIVAAVVKVEKPKVVAKKTVKQDTIAVKKPVVVPSPVVVIPAAAADVAKRKIVNTQEVFFTADSLTLTLYDNGEVDGDVVSVLLNGKVIFEKAALTTKPNRKTIYIDKAAGSDSLQLVMYAENLGSIPPNTGLLVVNDGDATYEVRFSADLQTNAAILLRRKK
ncbi:hypothetical protein LK994_04840 [Ferruginibacter lapsinanis]|uniref:hypothetical protein n=1 Tax=Ferruginibacter lapsinanis TaxID=563172 RepID=UPI001E5E9B98|nr:hypothetical protein [Ferruginibacter lapsinanis]UEG50800.1 hypothetical protein LK994_04840 [Ferruginibacter lapsinanis]